MTNRLAVATTLAFALLLPPAAQAADFSHVRCDNPHFEAFMASHLPRMKNANTGARLDQREQVHGISNAHAVLQSSDKLICEISLSLVIHGLERQVRGRFTIQQFPGHRQTWHWQPLY